MAKSAQKVTLSPSRDIPFDKLVLNQSNVRRIKAGISIEDLTEDIVRRGLLQSLSVRPVLADDGSETGKFEIPAGGRSFHALSIRVKQNRLAKTTPIPCIVRDAKSTILAEDDSLAENMQRAALHPLDQFRAFVALREKGQGDEEIAAAFFVTPQVVKQRLKLAAVAPALTVLASLRSTGVSCGPRTSLGKTPTSTAGSNVDGIVHITVITSAGQALGANVPDEEDDGPLKPLTKQMTQSDLAAQATDLDTVEAGWELAADTYLNRAPKARILKVVREVKGQGTAQLLDHLKMGEMATEAARLLKGSGWCRRFFVVAIWRYSTIWKGRGRLRLVPTPTTPKMSICPPSLQRTCRSMRHRWRPRIDLPQTRAGKSPTPPQANKIQQYQ